MRMNLHAESRAYRKTQALYAYENQEHSTWRCEEVTDENQTFRPTGSQFGNSAALSGLQDVV